MALAMFVGLSENHYVNYVGILQTKWIPYENLHVSMKQWELITCTVLEVSNAFDIRLAQLV